MQTSESIKAIAPALLKAQKSIKAAIKGSQNPFFKSKYADILSVLDAVKGPLNENDIIVLQPHVFDAISATSFVETALVHTSGEWMSSQTPIVTAKANDPQALGSAITYARRYSLQSFVSLPAEDDDGEGAMSRNKKKVELTKEQIKSLHEGVETDPKILNNILKAYGISNLEDLPKAKYDECLGRINAYLDRKAT